MAALIFLHGGPGLPDYMEDIFGDRFSAAVKTIFYTQSQKNITGIDDLIRELELKVKKVKAQEIFLVGHSWGGVLALEYAKRNPQKLSGLITIDAPYDASFEADYAKKRQELGMGADTPMEKIFLSPSERETWTAYVQKVFEQCNLEVATLIENTFLHAFNFTEFLRTSALPILNIFGAEDLRIPASTLRSYNKISPRIRNFEVSGGGHFPFFLELQRKRIVSEIESFSNARR